MDCLIGLDIGTSSVKGVLITADGKIIHSVRAPFIYQRSGAKVEIAPDVFLETCYFAIRCLAEHTTADIKAVCASSASGNLLLLDNAGNPLTNIINWQDQRPDVESALELKNIDSNTVYQTVGWGVTHKSFPLAQLCYMRRYTPQLLDECAVICMSTEYLYFKLTGQWGISTSAGTPFYLIDQVDSVYSKQILDTLNIDEAKLPPIYSNCHILGYIQTSSSKACGLTPGIPLILGTFDHPSAARGVGVLNEGQMLLSCGTSWVTLYPIKDRQKALSAKMLVDPFLSPIGPWAGMTSLSALSENLQHCILHLLGESESPFQLLSTLASQSVPGANGLRIDPTDPPSPTNITCFSNSDIARAIMEGTVGLLKHHIDALAAQGITATSAIMVGGPSEDPLWASLIKEICGISVEITRGAYAGAVGAAMIAGIGVGIYTNENDAITKWNNCCT